MKVEYINPFVNALSAAFSTVLSCEVQRGQISLNHGCVLQHDVSGVIGLSGNAVGTVVLSLSAPVAMGAASTMLMTEVAEINADVVDAVGELANMVAGAAKAKLEQYNMSISLPTVITGSGHEVRFPSNITPITIPFETQWGPLTLDVGLAEVGGAG